MTVADDQRNGAVSLYDRLKTVLDEAEHAIDDSGARREFSAARSAVLRTFDNAMHLGIWAPDGWQWMSKYPSSICHLVRANEPICGISTDSAHDWVYGALPGHCLTCVQVAAQSGIQLTTC
jgi:hypothetical protein